MFGTLARIDFAIYELLIRFVNPFLGPSFEAWRCPNKKRPVLADFGGNLRRLRVAAGLTQAKLAERVGLELRTVQKFEAGEINIPLATLTVFAER